MPMEHNFLNWETFQMAIVGGLSGALRGIADTPPSVRGLILAIISGCIATPLFGPTMAVGIRSVSGNIFTPENVWLLAGAITGILGSGVVRFVMAFVGILANKAGLGK